jgi:hypothetical protein
MIKCIQCGYQLNPANQQPYMPQPADQTNSDSSHIPNRSQNQSQTHNHSQSGNDKLKDGGKLPQNINQQPIQQFQGIPTQVIAKPTFGVCTLCNSFMMQFHDNGEGVCLNCGWTFNWMDPDFGQHDERIDSNPDNPFFAKEEEVIPLEERKAEIETENHVLKISDHTLEELTEKDSVSSPNKINSGIEKKLSNEHQLMMLEIRYSKGEVSNNDYEAFRKKLIANLLDELEEKLNNGKISKKAYEKQKKELES